MRYLALFITVNILASSAPAISQQSERPAMACDVGPISKKYGKSDWLVYSCADGKSVVVVSAAGNPALPFYFMLFPEGDGIRLYGEGTGQKSATEPAYNELKQLSVQDVAAIVSATKSAGAAK